MKTSRNGVKKMESILLVILGVIVAVVLPALLFLGSDRREPPWEKWGLDEPKEVENNRKP
jgi:hypothetical protein